MVRVLLGVLKGGIVGAGIGYLASRIGISGGALAWAVAAVVGATVGLVCGRAPWRHDTIWTPILKGVFGLLVGVGLYFVARKLLGSAHLPLSFVPGSAERPIAEVPALVGTAIGVLYGIFVEIDEGGGGAKADPSAAKVATKAATKGDNKNRT